MASLQIDALRAAGTASRVAVSVTLTDADGGQVDGYTADGVIVRGWSGHTDIHGELTLDLTPNANITPANTYYTIVVAGRSFLVSKGSGTETLEDALATTPEALGPIATLDGLSNVDTAGKADGDALVWDADTGRWVAEAGGAGGVTSVSGSAPITSTGGATPTIGITAATSGAAGSMSAADKSKLDGVEAGATADQSAAELLAAVKTVDGAGSGLDADLLDGQHATAFEAAGTAAALVDDLSGVSDAAAARTNLGLGGLATLSAVGSAQITDGAIVNDDVNASAAIALSKLASIATARLLGRTTAGSGAIEELTQAGVFGFLGTGTPSASNFLRGDGTWSTPAGGGSVATDTIFDAKGDLAVGTGADTASKLTVGANSKVLVADSAQATGAKWDYAVPAQGNAKNGATTYYTQPGFVGGAGAAALSMSANVRYFFPLVVTTAMTVDQLAIEQTTAAAAGKLFRIGLIAADEWWQPTGSALIDSGDFAADGANGVKTYTPGAAVLLPPGRYLGTVHSDGTPAVRYQGGTVATGTWTSTTIGTNIAIAVVSVSTALAAVDATAWDTITSSSSMRCGIWLRLSDPTS